MIAYSSFPGEPPASALFGRPGQGVALQSGQVDKADRQVLCVNPAALAGGAADLDSFFPSRARSPTPWVEFPGLYSARCETEGGATWLEVKKATGSLDKRPVVTEDAGADWGYHTDDVNLALGNLVVDVASAEAAWTATRARLNDFWARQWKSRDGPTAMAKSISSRYSATTFEEGGANGSAPSPRSSRPRTRSTTAERAALR